MKIPAGVTVSGSGRVKYPRDLADYGEFYGRTEVAVRAWVRHGKGIGDLPPLDDAAEMVLWWKRNMKNAVPDYLERVAIGSKPVDLPALPPPVSGESVSLTMDMAGSAMDSLNRLRSATALCFAQYQKALEAGDLPAADLWRKDWLAAEEKQRHWEKDINRIQKERGDLVHKGELIAKLTTLAGTLRRNFQAAMKSFARDVAPNLSDAEMDAYAEPHVEDCFRRLRENDLSAALQG
jgi:hypothetical protein